MPDSRIILPNSMQPPLRLPASFHPIADNSALMNTDRTPTFTNTKTAAAPTGPVENISVDIRAAHNPDTPCAANFRLPSPDNVLWSGENCETMQVVLPSSDTVPHFTELLKPHFLNGIFLQHIIGKQEACNRILKREDGWTADSYKVGMMFPMVKDKNGNMFYILTRTSDLFRQVEALHLWGGNAVFMSINREDLLNPGWMRGDGYAERLRSMFVPHESELQRRYAPNWHRQANAADTALAIWTFGAGAAAQHQTQDGSRGGHNWNKTVEHSIAWTKKFAGEEDAKALLKWHQDGGIMGQTFYDTMLNIEKSGRIRNRTFVFLIDGQPKQITEIIVQIASSAASALITAFTGIVIPAQAIGALLGSIVKFAEGKADWTTFLDAAVQIGYAMLSTAGPNGQPMFKEDTMKFIESGYKVATTLIRTKNVSSAGLVLGRELIEHLQAGTIQLPSFLRVEGKQTPILSVIQDMAFEKIREITQTDYERSTQYLTTMNRAITNTRLANQQLISNLRRGVDKIEAAYNGALDVMGKIASGGGASIVEDQLLRNAIALAANPGELLVTPNLGNLFSAVLNIPSFRDNDAQTPEEVQSFAGVAANLGFLPSVFDKLQFSALAKAAEEAVRKELPFSLPATLDPDRADDYRIKIEKCFNVEIYDGREGNTQVSVPDTFDADNAAASSASGGAGSSAGSRGGSSAGSRGGSRGGSSAGSSAAGNAASSNGIETLKRAAQLPPFVRRINQQWVICIKNPSEKQKKNPEAKNAADGRTCIPFLGESFTLAERSEMLSAIQREQRLANEEAALGALLNDILTGNSVHPFGQLIACVAEAHAREKTSESVLRQLYDNLPNERMQRRLAEPYLGDEGVVYHRRYSRVPNSNGQGLAPLLPSQENYAAIFVCVVLEEVARQCYQGWQHKEFWRNAQIFDPSNTTQASLRGMNGNWKTLDTGGCAVGAVFVERVPASGTAPERHRAGIVTAINGDAITVVEADAFRNAGRGSSADSVQMYTVQRSDLQNCEFYHVWDYSRTLPLQSERRGRCCTVPELGSTQARAMIAGKMPRPEPLLSLPAVAVSTWLPTDDAERTDARLREARSAWYVYHSPQQYLNNPPETFWKALRPAGLTALFPNDVPKTLKNDGWQRNPDLLHRDDTVYEYRAEGVLEHFYRRPKTAAPRKRPSAPRVAQKLTPRQLVERLQRKHSLLRDHVGLADAAAVQRTVDCVAMKQVERRQNVQMLVRDYGGDSLMPNGYTSSDNTCAMFAWLMYQDLQNCMGVARAACKLAKSARVFDQKGTRDNKSLFHGTIALGVQPTRTPSVGAIFCKPRAAEEAQNRNRDLVREGIEGKGGHCGIVTKITAQGFETIESSNGSQREGSGALVFRKTYTNADVQQKAMYFLPVQECLARGTGRPIQESPYCCPPREERGCAACAGGGTKQPDGSCQCPPDKQPDPANPCNCVPRPQERPSCTEPEPGRDPECKDGMWIQLLPGHRRDTTRNKYSAGGCWYCEKGTPPERRPSCPPEPPSSLGTGWERVPAGDPCTDTTRWNYFKTSTGDCCFRKPKGSTVPPPPPPERQAPPPSERPPEPPPSTCNTCEVYQDWADVTFMKPGYKDWNDIAAIYKGYVYAQGTPDEQWFIEVGGKLIPYNGDGDAVELEAVTIVPDTASMHTSTVTPAVLGKKLDVLHSTILRNTEGEPNTTDEIKSLLKTINEKITTYALHSPRPQELQALQTTVQEIAKTVQEKPLHAAPFDAQVITGRVQELESSLKNVVETALNAKLAAINKSVEQLATAIEAANATPVATQTATTVAKETAAHVAAPIQQELRQELQHHHDSIETFRHDLQRLQQAVESPQAMEKIAEIKRDVERINQRFAEAQPRIDATELKTLLAPAFAAIAVQIEDLKRGLYEQRYEQRAALQQVPNAVQSLVQSSVQPSLPSTPPATLLPAVAQRLAAEQSTAVNAETRRALELARVLVQDVSARAQFGADVPPAVLQRVESLNTLIHHRPAGFPPVTAVEIMQHVQPLAAALQTAPPPPAQCVDAAKQVYEEQIALLRAEIQRLQAQQAALALQAKQQPERREQRKKTLLQMMNLLGLLRQQCSACSSCEHAQELFYTTF